MLKKQTEKRNNGVLMSKKYDILIVGAGVTGAWAAYYLSHYNLSVCVVEKGNDIAQGSTKANSAIIHAGYDPEPGKMMTPLNVRGNEIVRKVYKDMAIGFKQIGSLVVSFDDDGDRTVRKLYDRGISNGVPELKLLSKEEVHKMEPGLAENVRGALYAGTGGICSPFDMCEAPMEIAIRNGVEFVRNFTVSGIKKGTKSVTVESSEGEKITGKLVINAAGVHAAEIAALFGDYSFKIHARRGEYSILDKSKGSMVSHVIFQPPGVYGKGILVSPTVDGNIIVGPTAEETDDPDDKKTTAAGQKKAFDGAKRSVPAVSEGDTITSFTGVRPNSEDGDFHIGFSEANRYLYNAAGIGSPGLTASPAIGEYLSKEIAEKFGAVPKAEYSEGRQTVHFTEMSLEEKNELIKKDPAYGRIICRCETITEGEIRDCITRPCGARDMDGVKRRVRAGMGRCQGGFCGPKVMEILSRYLGIPMTEVTKKGGKSAMLTERSDV